MRTTNSLISVPSFEDNNLTKEYYNYVSEEIKLFREAVKKKFPNELVPFKLEYVFLPEEYNIYVDYLTGSEAEIIFNIKKLFEKAEIICRRFNLNDLKIKTTFEYLKNVPKKIVKLDMKLHPTKPNPSIKQLDPIHTRIDFLFPHQDLRKSVFCFVGSRYETTSEITQRYNEFIEEKIKLYLKDYEAIVKDGIKNTIMPYLKWKKHHQNKDI